MPAGAGGQTRAPGRAAAAIRDLHPGYFAFVMATGVISIGTFLLGPSWLSRVLLVVTAAGLVVLSVALVIRLVRFRSGVVADIRAPERVFGFFTITAGLDVLGVRLSYAGHPLATAILAGGGRRVPRPPARPARGTSAGQAPWGVAAWRLMEML